MKTFKWLTFGGTLTAILLFVIIWWQLPEKVEMATYVPAETLVYLEANDLPEVLRALTATDAWRELAPIYEVEAGIISFGWWSQLLAKINLGSTETIVFGRSQIAVALLGINAADGTGDALRVKPQLAIVFETKSSRAQSFLEKQVGAFAKRQFGEVNIEKSEREGITWTIFRSRADEQNLFAAVSGTIAIIGNDEAVVQACLDAKIGRRKSLIDNENLAKMRMNVESQTAFVFGYVTPEGVKQLSPVAAIFVAGRIAEDPQAIGFLAQSLPPFTQKTVAGIGWTARAAHGKIEDRFFAETPPDLIARLREPFAATEATNLRAAEFLPANVDSVSVYKLKNPQAAWRAAAHALIARLDTMSAAVFSGSLGNLLAPYGIQKADEFLGAVKGEIVTARLSENNETIAFAETNDENQVKASLFDGSLAASSLQNVRQNGILLAQSSNTKSDGSIKSQSPAARASDFVDGAVLLGSQENLQLCRSAVEKNQNLQKQNYWREFSETKLLPNPAFVRTLARDSETPTRFVKIFGKEKTKNSATSPTAESAAPWAWSIAETRLMREGFERRAVSSFGFIATLATNFSED